LWAEQGGNRDYGRLKVGPRGSLSSAIEQDECKEHGRRRDEKRAQGEEGVEDYKPYNGCPSLTRRGGLDQDEYLNHDTVWGNCRTFLEFAVAWARNTKLAAVNEVVRYDAKVDRNGEPDILDRKKGMAVMTTINVGQNVQQNAIYRGCTIP